MKIKIVTEVLFKAIVKSLNLEENSFLNQFGEQSLMQTRFNFYPPCSRPDLVHGVKPQTDRSGITILLQDKEVEGLQIVVDGKWYRVPVIYLMLMLSILAIRCRYIFTLVAYSCMCLFVGYVVCFETLKQHIFRCSFVSLCSGYQHMMNHLNKVM